MAVLLETTLGDVVVELRADAAPALARNFVALCGARYYNDCAFFRVERGARALTGDPGNTGRGGACADALRYGEQAAWFPRPPRARGGARLSHARRGTVSMTAGPRGFASQFFFTLADGLGRFDAEHAPFGQVGEGWETLERLGAELVDGTLRPYRCIRVRHTIVLHDPFGCVAGARAVGRGVSPPPAQEPWGDMLPSDAEGESGAVLEGARAAREARSRAEVLEMLGDIRDADDAPPENVLFVCKLNPVTSAEDLEIIFSRFGECRVDVLRDGESGESLCYGFVEYAGKEMAEKAFFKFDNCLVDDRRIRVDFSQSVSRLWRESRRRLRRVGGARVGGAQRRTV